MYFDCWRFDSAPQNHWQCHSRYPESPTVHVGTVLRFCFIAPYHFTALLNLRLLVFGFTHFGWLHSNTLTLFCDGSIIFYSLLFELCSFFRNALGRKTRPWCKFCTGRGVGLDSIRKIVSKELHIPMIVIVNEWHFENSAEEMTKQVVELVRNLVAHGDAREGKWRGNGRLEWVASTLTPPSNVVYPALLKLMRTPRLPAVDWTDATTDLNGLVRFGERQNLVSARVPSRSARAITLRLNRHTQLTKKKDDIKLGKRKRYRKKERDEETK